MHIDLGSVPDWLAGGGAIAALAWARKAAKAASRTDERQGEQLALIQREKQRSQAEHVAVWFDFSWDSNRPHRLVLRNASELPVYELFVWINLTLGSLGDHRPDPDESPPRTLVFRYVYCLPPTGEALTRDVSEIPPNVPLYSDTERSRNTCSGTRLDDSGTGFREATLCRPTKRRTTNLPPRSVHSGAISVSRSVGAGVVIDVRQHGQAAATARHRVVRHAGRGRTASRDGLRPSQSAPRRPCCTPLKTHVGYNLASHNNCRNVHD